MKNSDVYRLVTLTDGKADVDAILRVLSCVASGALPNDLRFLNYFHEVPVSYSATIQSIDGDSVQFAVHEHQGLVVKNDRHTLIKSAHFPKELAVHAYAAYTSVQKRTTILHGFSYAQVRAERREAVRVAVRQPLPVAFTFEGTTINGLMRDISGTGVSIVTPDVLCMEGNQAGQLSFTIMGSPVQVQGTFVRSLKGSDDSHVYVFRMVPDLKTDAVIGQFSYQRQIEILKDLKEGAGIEGAELSEAAG